MAFAIHRGETVAEGSQVVVDRRLYVTADRSRVVEDGDPEAAYLWATPGMQVSAEMLATLEGEQVPEPEPDDDEFSLEELEELWTLKTDAADYLERSPDGPKAALARQIVAARAAQSESEPGDS